MCCWEVLDAPNNLGAKLRSRFVAPNNAETQRGVSRERERDRERQRERQTEERERERERQTETVSNK